MFKNLLYFLILIMSPSISLSWTQWVDIDCSKIKNKANINHTYFTAQRCWQSNSSFGFAWAFDFDDGENYLWMDVARVQDANTVWANDYAYQNIKVENIKSLIADYDLGNSPIVDQNHSNLHSSNRKIKFNYRNFKTSLGKGFYGGQLKGLTYFTFGYFTTSKSSNLNDYFISELLSSLTVTGINKGVLSSIKASSNSNLNETTTDSLDNNSNTKMSGDSFISMCKNSKLSDLDKDVAALCLEKLN